MKKIFTISILSLTALVTAQSTLAKKFIYDDQILNTNFYQIATKENTSLKRFNKEKNKEVSYGEIIDDFKIVTLIEKKFIKKGLQFKTTINDEVVYIDIE